VAKQRVPGQRAVGDVNALFDWKANIMFQYDMLSVFAYSFRLLQIDVRRM
jgi:hypothetical protein